jgi:hypothetical protein
MEVGKREETDRIWKKEKRTSYSLAGCCSGKDRDVLFGGGPTYCRTYLSAGASGRWKASYQILELGILIKGFQLCNVDNLDSVMNLFYLYLLAGVISLCLSVCLPALQ